VSEVAPSPGGILVETPSDIGIVKGGRVAERGRVRDIERHEALLDRAVMEGTVAGPSQRAG
jgi:hypothetical protein